MLTLGGRHVVGIQVVVVALLLGALQVVPVVEGPGPAPLPAGRQHLQAVVRLVCPVVELTASRQDNEPNTIF